MYIYLLGETLVWISLDLSLSNFLPQIKNFGQWWNIFLVFEQIFSFYLHANLFSKWDRMTINLSYVIVYNFVLLKKLIYIYIYILNINQQSKWNPLFTFLLAFSSSYLWLKLNNLFLKLTHFSCIYPASLFCFHWMFCEQKKKYYKSYLLIKFAILAQT